MHKIKANKIQPRISIGNSLSGFRRPTFAVKWAKQHPQQSTASPNEVDGALLSHNSPSEPKGTSHNKTLNNKPDPLDFDALVKAEEMDKKKEEGTKKSHKKKAIKRTKGDIARELQEASLASLRLVDRHIHQLNDTHCNCIQTDGTHANPHKRHFVLPTNLEKKKVIFMLKGGGDGPHYKKHSKRNRKRGAKRRKEQEKKIAETPLREQTHQEYLEMIRNRYEKEVFIPLEEVALFAYWKPDAGRTKEQYKQLLNSKTCKLMIEMLPKLAIRLEVYKQTHIQLEQNCVQERGVSSQIAEEHRKTLTLLRRQIRHANSDCWAGKKEALRKQAQNSLSLSTVEMPEAKQPEGQTT